MQIAPFAGTLCHLVRSFIYYSRDPQVDTELVIIIRIFTVQVSLDHKYNNNNNNNNNSDNNIITTIIVIILVYGILK
jgi:hypothetical protein